MNTPVIDETTLTTVSKDEMKSMISSSASIVERRKKLRESGQLQPRMQVDPSTGAVLAGDTISRSSEGFGTSFDERMSKFQLSARRQAMMNEADAGYCSTCGAQMQNCPKPDCGAYCPQCDGNHMKKHDQEDSSASSPSDSSTESIWNSASQIQRFKYLVARSVKESVAEDLVTKNYNQLSDSVKHILELPESRRSSMTTSRKRVREDDGHVGQQGGNGTEGGVDQIPDTKTDVTNGEPQGQKSTTEANDGECANCGMVDDPAPDGKCKNCGAVLKKTGGEEESKSIGKKVAVLCGTRAALGKIESVKDGKFTVKLNKPVENKGKKIESVVCVEAELTFIEGDEEPACDCGKDDCKKCHPELGESEVCDKCEKDPCECERADEELDPDKVDNSMGTGQDDTEPGRQDNGTKSENLVRDAIKKIAAGESADKVAKSLIDSRF